MADVPTTGPAAVVHQLRQLWGRQPRRRQGLAVVVALGIAGAIAYATLGHKVEPWTAVAEGSSPEDAQELYSVLAGRNLPVRLHDGKVEVASERVSEARAVAASAGLPHTGKGLELFDASSLGQSSFAEQVNYRRALQGELARSITAMAQVESARVLIAFGKRSLVRDQEQPASASVALHLHAGQTLTADQVRGVRQLVAASIEGLRPEAVAIVDNHGNLLDAADPTAVDHRAEIERTVTGRVRTMLERVVGAGKVSVVTSADVDDRKVSETQEVYDADHPALRSESRTLEGGDVTSGIGGIAGTRGNLPGAPSPSPTPGSGSAGPQRLQETKNYEVSRTVRQTTKPDVQLQKLHVAVVVDYKTGADGKPAPRGDKELTELTALARQAAGIDDARGDKIELHSIPFASDADAAAATPPVATSGLPLGLPLPVLIGAGAGLLAVIGVVLFLVLRRRRPAPTPTLALPAPVGELERVLEARSTDRAAIDGEATAATPTNLLPGRTVRDRVLDAVRADVDRTAGVLTEWLAEPRRSADAKADIKIEARKVAK
ncbi:MAG TPA: flagellar basal-body MS-ring/collar protein FliF [Kofleriaceae bacterium]|jgi:flagellar M-ring protein FliF|nr:flagellar basal-body MS-ring/collar protein FliF [Kofleriaceae bacterium]